MRLQTRFLPLLTAVSFVFCLALPANSQVVTEPDSLPDPSLPGGFTTETDDSVYALDRVFVSSTGDVHLLYEEKLADTASDAGGNRTNFRRNILHKLQGNSTVFEVTEYDWNANPREFARHARAVMDADDNLHVVWRFTARDTIPEEDTLVCNRIEYRKRSANGTWSSTVQITTCSDSFASRQILTPTISLSDDGRIFVLFAFRRGAVQTDGSDLYYYYTPIDSAETAANWIGPIRITNSAVHKVPAALSVRNGKMNLLHFVTDSIFYDPQDSYRFRFNADSTCHGDTCWTAPVLVNHESCNCTRASMLTDSLGRAHVVWNSALPSLCDTVAQTAQRNYVTHAYYTRFVDGVGDSAEMVTLDSLDQIGSYLGYRGGASGTQLFFGASDSLWLLFTDDGIDKYAEESGLCPPEGPCPQYRQRLTTIWLAARSDPENMNRDLRWSMKPVLACDSTANPAIAWESDTTFHLAWVHGSGDHSGSPDPFRRDIHYRQLPDTTAYNDSANRTHVWEGTRTLCHDVAVPYGDTLEISAGTTVRIDPDVDCGASGGSSAKVEIRVHGTLKVLGTEQAPVVFESMGGTAGDWAGIRFERKDPALAIYNQEAPLSTGLIQWCEIRHASIGIFAKECEDSIIVENTVIESCATYGVYVRKNEDGIVRIRDSKILDCGSKGVYVDDNEHAEVSIRNTEIRRNGTIGLHVIAGNLDVYGSLVSGHSSHEVLVNGEPDSNIVSIDSCYLGGVSSAYDPKGFEYSDSGAIAVGDKIYLTRNTFQYLDVGIDIVLRELLEPGYTKTRISAGDGGLELAPLYGNEILDTDTIAVDLHNARNVEFRQTAFSGYETGVLANGVHAKFGTAADTTSGYNCFEAGPATMRHISVSGASPGTFTAVQCYWAGASEASCVTDTLFESNGSFDISNCLPSLPFSYPWGWWDPPSAKRGNLDEVDDSAAPSVFRIELRPNRPNPFNPVTKISYSVPGAEGERSDVNLSIYNIAGRRVETLVDGPMEAGVYQLLWPGPDHPVRSGVYFVRLQAGGQTRTQKITLVK